MKLSTSQAQNLRLKVEALSSDMQAYKGYTSTKDVQQALNVLEQKLSKADLDTLVELKDEQNELGANVNIFEQEYTDVEEGIEVDTSILDKLYAFIKELSDVIDNSQFSLDDIIRDFLLLTEPDQIALINEEDLLPHIMLLPFLADLGTQVQYRLFERIAEKEHIEVSDNLIEQLGKYPQLVKLLARKTRQDDLILQICVLKNEEAEQILIKRDDLVMWDYWGMLSSAGKKSLIPKIDSFDSFLIIESKIVHHSNTDEINVIWAELAKKPFFEEIVNHLKKNASSYKILKDRFPHLFS